MHLSTAGDTTVKKHLHFGHGDNDSLTITGLCRIWWPVAPRLDWLPALATTLIPGGLTYYIVNDTYYRKQGTEYILIQPPEYMRPDLNVVDYNNKRYYARNGSYYQKDIDGNYTQNNSSCL
ncbi:hypothetical protein [uncultured Cedecea sp.]|uniref:hypothetical protein n=1 Tax=uncultured Cedecea sp. TaxID=988762 RepID=UPI00260B4190|nr:hypothetical protein [uncultured Cedecea sp.]